MDDYCVALIVLLLFLIYIDNQNKVEGYDEFGAPYPGTGKGNTQDDSIIDNTYNAS